MSIAIADGALVLSPENVAGCHGRTYRELLEFIVVTPDRVLPQGLGVNQLPESAFAHCDIELQGEARLKIVQFEDDRIGGILCDRYFVDTPDNPCKSFYETEDWVATISNPDALEASGILAVGRRIAKAREAIHAFGITRYAIEGRRSGLLEAANAAVASLDPTWVAENFVHGLLCDFQNTGVRADTVWKARKVWCELCGLSDEEVRAFFFDEVGYWPVPEPAADSEDQFRELSDRHGNHPMVREALEAFLSHA